MTDGSPRVGVDTVLAERLREVGLDPSEVSDPTAAWHRLHARFGRRATLVDRYALEAAHRGIPVDELDSTTRERLGAEILEAQFPGLELQAEAARQDGPVAVVPYDASWPVRFETWRRRLATALGPAADRIEHVGSTAVPGLAAKPILDLQVSVRNPDDEAAYVTKVEGCGLLLRSREPGHRYFRPPADRPREVHVHVCATGSSWERDHLLFRDYVRAHPTARDAYGALKFDLARRHTTDRLAYTDAKSSFILDALAAAEAWARQTGWPVPAQR